MMSEDEGIVAAEEAENLEDSNKSESCDSENENDNENNHEPQELGDSDDDNDDDDDDAEQEIKQHSSYEQVMLDVNRCAGRLERMRRVYLHRRDDDDEPPEDLTRELELQRLSEDSGRSIDNSASIEYQDNSSLDSSTKIRRKLASDIAGDQRDQRKLKTKLARLIVKLLIKRPSLHYYQGFHDVCLTYMTLLGAEKAFIRLGHLVDSHFGIFMQPTMNETQEFLALIPAIIGLHDYKVQDFLEKAEVGNIFALSWVITWFSHVIQDENDVEMIFNFLEGEDPHMVLYLCASIVIHQKDQLLELEPEMSTVHHYLCQIPRKEKLPLDDLIKKAQTSFNRWRPEVVKQKLDQRKSSKLGVYDYNLLNSLASQFGLAVPRQVAFGAKTAVVVLIIASAIALQIDRWIR